MDCRVAQLSASFMNALDFIDLLQRPYPPSIRWIQYLFQVFPYRVYPEQNISWSLYGNRDIPHEKEGCFHAVQIAYTFPTHSFVYVKEQSVRFRKRVVLDYC